jgi:hypothetical protein
MKVVYILVLVNHEVKVSGVSTTRLAEHNALFHNRHFLALFSCYKTYVKYFILCNSKRQKPHHTQRRM